MKRKNKTQRIIKKRGGKRGKTRFQEYIVSPWKRNVWIPMTSKFGPMYDRYEAKKNDLSNWFTRKRTAFTKGKATLRKKFNSLFFKTKNNTSPIVGVSTKPKNDLAQHIPIGERLADLETFNQNESDEEKYLTPENVDDQKRDK
jgi:hypothetical protein